MLDLERICDVFEDEYKNFKPFANERQYSKFKNCIKKALSNNQIAMPKDEEELKKEAHEIVYGNYFDDIMEFVNESPSQIIDFTYNFESPNSIKIKPNEMLSIKNINNQNLGKWQNVNVSIRLTLKKGGNIDKIDEYVDSIVKEFKKVHNCAIKNVYVNFGEKKLGKKNVRYLIDENGLENLVKLQSVAKKYQAELLFGEMDSSTRWNLQQVIKANKCVNDLAKNIKDNNLSPFEALLYICTWLQKNIKYNEAELENDETTNTIVGAVNNLKIRCVGFSQFVLAVVEVLKDYGYENGDILKSSGSISVSYSPTYIEACKVYASNHSQTMFYIKDKKYNIDGEVIADPLGFKNYGFDLRKTDKGITAITLSPLATFSRLKQSNKLYKIYSGNLEMSSVLVTITPLHSKYHVDGKNKKQVLKETRQNAKLARKSEQHGISQSQLDRAYNKIIPLIFKEAKEGDMIAPKPTFTEENWECDKTIAVCDNETKNFWEKMINNNDNTTTVFNDDERIL